MLSHAFRAVVLALVLLVICIIVFASSVFISSLLADIPIIINWICLCIFICCLLAAGWALTARENGRGDEGSDNERE